MISRRDFLGSLTLPALAQPRLKPNIVVLLADDLGYGELSFQGNEEILTLDIDTIPAHGVRFTQGYVSAPFCCPSRAGLMTGRYQTRFGHEMNSTGKTNLDPKVGLPLSEKTIADHLKAAGYATGVMGKWHLGNDPKFHPQRRGFDEFFGFLHEGHFYYPPPYRGAATRLRTNEPPYDNDNPVMRGTRAITEPEYLTDAIAREAVSFIDRHRADPFFLYVPFNAIHSPMQAPVPRLKDYEYIRDEHRRLFAAMLGSMNDATARILGKIRDLGLEQDTLIVFLSDNGGPTAELTSSNKPLRGGKGQLFEGGIRVPFAMQWKGRIPAGVFDHPVSSLDILPTALAAVGLPLPSGLDGVDLLPFLTGAKRGRPHESLFWRYGPNIALRHGDWKLVRQGSADFRLFHLGHDPSESHDIAAENPAVTRDLRARLDSVNGEMQAPLW
ncbi:MAG: sulfatase-like hydrolase/transferase [Bryobacteraceae bacterium]